jgi:hypothetical protein
MGRGYILSVYLVTSFVWLVGSLQCAPQLYYMEQVQVFPDAYLPLSAVLCQVFVLSTSWEGKKEKKKMKLKKKWLPSQ